MSERLIALDLHQSPLSTAISLFERLLDLVAVALADQDDNAGSALLTARISEYKEALGQSDATLLRTRGEALLTACSHAAETHTRLRASRRVEMAELITMIRDMTVALTGQATAISAEVTSSAARFAALGDVRDIRLLRERLSIEVTRLKDTAVERERKWQGLVTSFGEKIAALEGELVVTEDEATHDSLTGVANRRLFDRNLEHLVKEQSRHFALAFVDVDNFKKINDEFGHEAGDRVLRGIARTLAMAVRAEDMVARISGDEFAIILESVTLDQAVSRVNAIAGQIGPSLCAEGYPPASISCGVAVFSPGDSAHSLAKRADDALYESKHHGRGRTTRTDPAGD